MALELGILCAEASFLPRALDVERPTGMRRIALCNSAHNPLETPETQR